MGIHIISNMHFKQQKALLLLTKLALIQNYFMILYELQK